MNLSVNISVNFSVKISGKRLLRFWFHTAFVEGGALLLRKSEIDGPHKDRKCKAYEECFQVEIYLEGCTESAAEPRAASRSAAAEPCRRSSEPSRRSSEPAGPSAAELRAAAQAAALAHGQVNAPPGGGAAAGAGAAGGA